MRRSITSRMLSSEWARSAGWRAPGRTCRRARRPPPYRDVSTCRSALRCCATRTTSPVTFWNIGGRRSRRAGLPRCGRRRADRSSSGRRRALGHAAVDGTAALGALFGPLARGLGLGALQVGLERPLADAGEIADQLQELVFFGGVHVGGEHDLDVDLVRLPRRPSRSPPARWLPSAAAGKSARHGRSC